MNTAEKLPAPGDSHRQLRPADPHYPSRWEQPPVQVNEQPPDEDVIDLREYWATLARRKWTIFTTVALILVLALIATFVATPIYRSTLLMKIDRETNQVVDYGNVVPDENAAAWRDDFYTTQYELLQSRTLARRVIDQLGLKSVETEDHSFFSEAKASVYAVLSTFASNASKEQDDGFADPDAATQQGEEDALLANLTIEPVRDSRLVRISYDSPSAAESAAVANAVATNFINLNLERRYDASSYAKDFLEDQLAQTRATLEDSEKRFVAYAREREIVNLDDRLEMVLNQLREMNAKLATATAERIGAEAEYQELLQARSNGAPAVLDSELVQTLKERRSDLEAEYQQKLEVFKPGYPAMQQLQRRINELNADIGRETQAVGHAVKAKFEAKVREEANLNKRIRELKDDALSLQDRSTDYETLKREVATNRALYDGLLQRMKEVGVAAGVGENNVSIVDPALVPLSPYKPSLRKNLAIAVALGLFLGIGLAFLLETLDDTLKASDEIEKRLRAPVLGQIPHASARTHGITDAEIPLLTFKDPKSAVAEAARSLRTSLLFSTPEGAPRILHVTSTSPGEGKTTTATNLAIACAQAGNKVLIVDCDLRNPSLHRAFNLPNATGLTNYLAGDIDPAEIAQPTQVVRLFSITSGPLPPSPVELLSGAKMLDLLSLAAERFDQVILDGPPVIGLADALVLANLAKASILVVEPGSTRARDLEAAVKRMHQGRAHILGAALAKVGRSGTGYGYGYDYQYNYLYNYGRNGREAALPELDRA